MPVEPKTIDNLGPAAYNRYAKDQTMLDTSFIKEAQFIPQKAEVSVTEPYIPSEFDQLFSVRKTVSWAHFTPPPEYSLDSQFFSYLLVPSLGDSETLESDSDKIESLETTLQASPQEQKERDTLASFFQILDKLNKILNISNSKRNQYQRG